MYRFPASITNFFWSYIIAQINNIVFDTSLVKVLFYCHSCSEFFVLTHSIPRMIVEQQKWKWHDVFGTYVSNNFPLNPAHMKYFFYLVFTFYGVLSPYHIIQPAYAYH